MAILNYTTKVDAARTALEIQRILSKHAATVTTEYGPNSRPSAVLFTLLVAGQSVSFRLPCNVDGVLSALHRDRVESRYRNREHAERVAWRIVKDWVEAQIAVVDAKQVQMAEVFLPYVVMGNNGATLFQWFENKQRQLAAGAPSPAAEAQL